MNSSASSDFDLSSPLQRLAEEPFPAPFPEEYLPEAAIPPPPPLPEDESDDDVPPPPPLTHDGSHVPPPPPYPETPPPPPLEAHPELYVEPRAVPPPVSANSHGTPLSSYEPLVSLEPTTPPQDPRGQQHHGPRPTSSSRPRHVDHRSLRHHRDRYVQAAKMSAAATLLTLTPRSTPTLPRRASACSTPKTSLATSTRSQDAAPDPRVPAAPPVPSIPLSAPLLQRTPGSTLPAAVTTPGSRLVDISAALAEGDAAHIAGPQHTPPLSDLRRSLMSLDTPASTAFRKRGVVETPDVNPPAPKLSVADPRVWLCPHCDECSVGRFCHLCGRQAMFFTSGANAAPTAYRGMPMLYSP